MKAVKSTLATLVLVSGTVLATAPMAQSATARNGVCEAGEFCYYYNSNHQGSVSDHKGSLANYGTTTPSCYTFKSAGNGRGLCIKNRAASVWNRTGQKVAVHYNSNYGGTKQTIAAGGKVNLNATLKNNNASHLVGGTSTGSYTPRDDYPYRGATSGIDRWNFYKGQCTSFAAWTVVSRLGIKDFSNQYGGGRFGNAINWDNNARAVGIPVYSTPRAGDIAVRNSGTYGHVAFVTKVNADGSFQVDEYNHVRADTYSHRRATRGTGSHQFDRFIRFKR
ncbi:CHAP domain-containing protein [Janibacter anophelis]|uniref:CHAP domain-containing protein n=1 Tax=Janibacter anophelis TaxID=319054 RepID=UPI003F81720C